MKFAVLLALSGLALAAAVPITGVTDMFDLADKNGDGMLSAADEVVEYLKLSSKQGPAPDATITDEHVHSMAKDLSTSLIEAGVTQLSRADVAQRLGDDAGSKAGWFSPAPQLKLKSAEAMAAGCASVEAIAASGCDGWTSAGTHEAVECAGFKDINGGRIVRGTVTIDRPIDIVYSAVAERTNWPHNFDSVMDEAPELRVTEGQGATLQLKWFSKWWAEATVQEMWCSATGDKRTSFATSVVDPRGDISWKALSVNVRTAGVVLEAEGGKTKLTYISDAHVSGFKPEWSHGAEKHAAVDIPVAIKTAIEAHL